MGVGVIERFFWTGVRNTHQKGLRMRGFRAKLLVRQKLVPTGSPIRWYPARRIDGRDLWTTDIPREKTLQCYQLEITLKDNRLIVCRFKDDHVFCLLHFRKRQRGVYKRKWWLDWETHRHAVSSLSTMIF